MAGDDGGYGMSRRSPRPPGARLRLDLGNGIAIGPGKADILEGIRETGSIAASGRRLRMSYKRAWSLVEAMNAAFREPLVETRRGGSAQGGAALTPMGDRVLDTFRRMETRTEAAIADDMAALRACLPDITPGA
ncbi:winged helix-turn-helix domain-containing protein [Marivibrio halodurans]|nr:LysR family transcriptional regulator [Marivibrio halodurans]